MVERLYKHPKLKEKLFHTLLGKAKNNQKTPHTPNGNEDCRVSTHRPACLHFRIIAWTLTIDWIFICSHVQTTDTVIDAHTCKMGNRNSCLCHHKRLGFILSARLVVSSLLTACSGLFMSCLVWRPGQDSDLHYVQEISALALWPILCKQDSVLLAALRATLFLARNPPCSLLSAVVFIRLGPEFPLPLQWQPKTPLLQPFASQKIHVCNWDQFQRISMLLWLQPSLKALEHHALISRFSGSKFPFCSSSLFQFISSFPM